MSYVNDDEPKIAYLVQVLFLDQEDAERAAEHVILFEGEPKDYAIELVDELGGISAFNSPEFYFDYDQYGRDIRMDGFDFLDDEEDRQFFMDMSDQDLGYHFVDEVFGGLENMSSEATDSYIDYDALARDMVLGGDIDEFEYDDTNYVIGNAQEDFTYFTNPVMCEDDAGNQTYSPSDPKPKSERPYRGICGGKGNSGGDNAGRRVAIKDGKPVKITHKDLAKKITRKGLGVLATQSYIPEMGAGSRRAYAKALKGHGYELQPTTYEYYDEKVGERVPKTIDFIREIPRSNPNHQMSLFSSTPDETPKSKFQKPIGRVVEVTSDTKDLKKYVLDYYGVRGTETYIPKIRSVIDEAIDIHVNNPKTTWDGGEGDSIDRELIRDIAYNLLGEGPTEYQNYALYAIEYSKKRKNPMVTRSAGGGATYQEYVLPSMDSPDFAFYNEDGQESDDYTLGIQYYPIESLEPYTAESLAETLTERLGVDVSVIDLGFDGKVYFYEVGMDLMLGTSEFSRMLEKAIPEGKFILYTDSDFQSGDPALFEDYFDRSGSHSEGMRHRPNPKEIYTVKSPYGYGLEEVVAFLNHNLQEYIQGYLNRRYRRESVFNSTKPSPIKVIIHSVTGIRDLPVETIELRNSFATIFRYVVSIDGDFPDFLDKNKIEELASRLIKNRGSMYGLSSI